MIWFGVVLMVIGALVAILAGKTLADRDPSGWDAVYVMGCFVGIICFISGIIVMTKGIEKQKHDRLCRANHEVMVRENDTALYQGKTIIFQHKTCVVSL